MGNEFGLSECGGRGKENPMIHGTIGTQALLAFFSNAKSGRRSGFKQEQRQQEEMCSIYVLHGAHLVVLQQPKFHLFGLQKLIHV